MWRLWNKLFGWHYVALTSHMLEYRYLRRVRKTKSGMPYVEFTPNTLWFLLKDGETDSGYKWVSLTW